MPPSRPWQSSTRLQRDAGVDLVLEATDRPEGLQLAAEAARIGGRCVLIGIPEGDRYALAASLARRKGLSVKFARRMGHVYPRAIELVRRGQVNVRRLATHHFPLDRAAEAFALQAAREGGIVRQSSTRETSRG